MHRGRIEHVSGLGVGKRLSRAFPQRVSIPLVIDRNSQRDKKDKVERAALDARRRLVLRHIVSPVNAFISETLEWEAGNRFAPLDVVHYLRTFELNPRSGAISIKCSQQTR